MIKKLLNCTLLLISLTVFVSCGKEEVKDEVANNQEIEQIEKEETKDVELVENSINVRNEFTQGTFFVDGIVKNNSDKKLKQIILEVTYRNDKDESSKTSEYLVSLEGEPNSEIEFSAEFTDFREIGSFNEVKASVKDYILE